MTRRYQWGRSEHAWKTRRQRKIEGITHPKHLTSNVVGLCLRQQVLLVICIYHLYGGIRCIWLACDRKHYARASARHKRNHTYVRNMWNNNKQPRTIGVITFVARRERESAANNNSVVKVKVMGTWTDLIALLCYYS